MRPKSRFGLQSNALSHRTRAIATRMAASDMLSSPVKYNNPVLQHENDNKPIEHAISPAATQPMDHPINLSLFASPIRSVNHHHNNTFSEPSQHHDSHDQGYNNNRSAMTPNHHHQRPSSYGTHNQNKHDDSIIYDDNDDDILSNQRTPAAKHYDLFPSPSSSTHEAFTKTSPLVLTSPLSSKKVLLPLPPVMVTVFGFHDSHVHDIITYMETLGAYHSISQAAAGHWIIAHYKSTTIAQEALKLHGSIIPYIPYILLGVRPTRLSDLTHDDVLQLQQQQQQHNTTDEYNLIDILEMYDRPDVISMSLPTLFQLYQSYNHNKTAMTTTTALPIEQHNMSTISISNSLYNRNTKDQVYTTNIDTGIRSMSQPQQQQHPQQQHIMIRHSTALSPLRALIQDTEDAVIEPPDTMCSMILSPFIALIRFCLKS